MEVVKIIFNEVEVEIPKSDLKWFLDNGAKEIKKSIKKEEK